MHVLVFIAGKKFYRLNVKYGKIALQSGVPNKLYLEVLPFSEYKLGEFKFVLIKE